jgi:hypothetical protein
MALIKVDEHLRVDRCPFCNVDRPNLSKIHETYTDNSEKDHKRFWRFYQCARCGGVVTATAIQPGMYAENIFPFQETAAKELPRKAHSFLEQAIQSIHAPAGAVMLAASSVDAMLKDKGYKEGSLYTRIENAAKDHLITEAMSKWAHQVRLDANEQRHADAGADLPSENDAKRSIHFVIALGQFLYVLPAMVEKGIEESKSEEET